MKLEITKIIDQYLQGELSEQDKLAFEKKLSESETLRKETELQKAVYEGAARAAIRTKVRKTAKSYHFSKTMQVIAASFIILAVSAALVFYISSHSRNSSITEEVAALINKIEKHGPIDDLKSEFFIVSGDSVILSRNGVLLSVPENAFLLDGKLYSGDALVQWQEALDAATIIKSGLSTMSGDKLLETQGMFAFQAYAPDGRKLEIDPKKGIYVQVPVEEYKSGMQLFEGKKNKEGIIDWQNPKPLMKIPVPVDMALLDFYPAGYEDSLNHIKLRKDKRYRDSLYLSMENFFGIGIMDSDDLYQGKGQNLFSSKCMTCHSMQKDNTGPALLHIREKWSAGGAKEGSIYQWVRNWNVAALKDPYAIKVARQRPTAMNLFPDLTTEQISSIFDYIDSQPREGIPPSMVLGFWNPKFNNTILATREFERRMPFIHATCNKKVLKLYINNLSKPMVELDKQVAKMGYNDFTFLAAEQVGALHPDNPHIRNLQNFYAKAVKKLQSEVENNRNVLLRKQQQWDRSIQKAREQEINRTSARQDQVLSEEFDFNMKMVNRQLGKTVGFQIYGGGMIYNIDKYVMDITIARKSDTITDPETGKTAKIAYNNFSFEVANADQYQKIFAYLFPLGINSYQRISGTQGKFSYPLNNGMTYHLAIVGISEKGYSYFQQTTLKGGAIGSIRLEKISETRLNASVGQLNASRIGKLIQIQDEIQWLIKEQQDYKEQRNRQEQKAFRQRIARIVFPCFECDCEN